MAIRKRMTVAQEKRVVSAVDKMYYSLCERAGSLLGLSKGFVDSVLVVATDTQYWISGDGEGNGELVEAIRVLLDYLLEDEDWLVQHCLSDEHKAALLRCADDIKKAQK